MNKLRTLSILLAGATLVGCGNESVNDIEVALAKYYSEEAELMDWHAKQAIEGVKELQGIGNAQCTQVDESTYKAEEGLDTYVCSYRLTFVHVDNTAEEPDVRDIDIASYVSYEPNEKFVGVVHKIVGSASELNLKFESIRDYL
ncbi:hypothetical protein QTV43_000576 [Vibrio vulnificus]|nr:hypothetical protein [Vibrio vulnificus]